MMINYNNRNIARSKTALDNKDFNAAIKYCNEELKKNKRNVDCYVIRGSAYNQLGQVEAAVLDFQTAMQLDPTNLDILKKLFFSYSKVNDIDKALMVCNNIINRYPSDNDELVFQEICRMLMEREQYDKCIALLEQIIKNSGEHEIYYHLLGLNLFYLRRYAEAVKAFKKALKKDHNVKYLISLVKCYEKMNDTGKAYEELLSYWKKHKDTDLLPEDKIKIVSTLAEICISDNNVDEGINWLNELLVLHEKREDKVEIEHKKAFLYKSQKNYNQALEIYQTIIRTNPNSIKEFLECGEIYQRQGKYQEALEEYKKILSLDPYNPDANINLANIYIMKQDFIGAKQILDAIYKDYRNNLAYLTKCLEIYSILFEKNKDEEGYEQRIFEILAQIISLNPTHLQNYEKLMDLYINNQEYDKAKEIIEVAVKIVPVNKVKLLQAYTLSFIDIDAAEHYYQAYLSYQGDMSEVLYYKAKNSYLLEDGETAVSLLEQCLHLNKHHQLALELLMQLNINHKQWDEALETCRQMISYYPINSDYYFKAGMILARNKRYEESITFFENAIVLNNFFLDAYYNLGNVYYKMKEFQESLKCYKVIIHLNADYNKDIYIKIADIYKQIRL